MAIVSGCILAASPAAAQCIPSLPRWTDGLAGCAGSLIRSEADYETDFGARRGWQSVSPELSLSWNSRIPFSVNDGLRWAGRGWSASARGGVRFSSAHLRIVLAPEVVSVENDRFPVLPAPDLPDRNRFANPWHSGIRRIDQPLRFGHAGYTQLAAGTSSIELLGHGVGVGASNAGMWWGPGIRNAIVMSTNAGGFPHLFLRTTRPYETPWGEAEARVVVGVLSESRFFNSSSSDDYRSLSAAVLTFRPAFDSGLTIGVARAMYASLGRRSALLTRSVGFLQPVESGASDGLQSVFARWVIPAVGTEFHAEWARLRIPSFRDLTVSPQEGQGYTLGAQWLSAGEPSARRFGVQLEATKLEQNTPPGRVEPRGYYTSANVPQGYTQRGQIIGAAIGSGGSSQWAHAYTRKAGTAIGLVLSRIRTEDEAYYQQPTGFTHFAHDVSATIGIRAATSLFRRTISLELLRTKRLNYLFQSGTLFDWDPSFDVHNTTLNLSIGPLR